MTQSHGCQRAVAYAQYLPAHCQSCLAKREGTVVNELLMSEIREVSDRAERKVATLVSAQKKSTSQPKAGFPSHVASPKARGTPKRPDSQQVCLFHDPAGVLGKGKKECTRPGCRYKHLDTSVKSQADELLRVSKAVEESKARKSSA